VHEPQRGIAVGEDDPHRTIVWARAEFDAKFERLGRPPTRRERNDFLEWEWMIEETEWERFYDL
jgi:hypothetical protein